MSKTKQKFFDFYLNSRRGMLELDLILNTFLYVYLFRLNYQTMNVLKYFLNESDKNLYVWIIKRQRCYNKRYNLILQIIYKLTDKIKYY
jgi:succinate dehydrogenase flavin-adding protein (antitoxin of CptAB toxin-antitoxin module)